jgi:hypothetical protein
LTPKGRPPPGNSHYERSVLRPVLSVFYRCRRLPV